MISGASRGEQVRTNAAALRWEPTDEDIDLLDEIYSAHATACVASVG